MRTGLIMKKVGMSSMFTSEGERVALTFLKLTDCIVVDHKTEEKHGYDALVVGCDNKRQSKFTKPMKEFFAKLNVQAKAKLKEFMVTKDSFIEVGTKLDVTHFNAGQFVDVVGTSVGKGFAGVMKRWNFSGLRASHGVSVSHRSPGSTGNRQDPGRVFKNKKMAGHLGHSKATLQNLKIVAIDQQKGLIMINGSVPGSKGSYVYVRDAVKKSS